MVKFFLLCLLAFGAYCALCVLAPSSWGTAFHVSGHSIPYIALCVCGVAYVGYKVMK